jgi:hypothetical protein
VGIDHHDEANVPSPEHPDRPPDHPDRPPEHPDHPPDHPRFETRNRLEYYADRRATEPATPSQPAKQPENPQPSTTWEETANLSRWMWTEYKRRWPPEDRPPPDSSTDPPGSWRSDSNRYLDSAANARIEAEYDRIVDREQQKISPAMRNIESQDPDRNLAGFENRLKGHDRIKEKVCGTIDDYNRSPEQAVSLVPDAIRYTLQYQEARYAQGVRTDILRLEGQGFKLDILKNSWSDDQYKGINSQWVDPDTGQRFEVQFHTRISFEAKQITHDSYERLRTGQPDEFEQMVLEAFQRKVVSEIPVPSGALDIPNYSRRGMDAREDHLLCCR